MATAASFWEQKDELIENLKKIKRRNKGNGGETDKNSLWETKLEGCVLDVQKKVLHAEDIDKNQYCKLIESRVKIEKQIW